MIRNTTANAAELIGFSCRDPDALISEARGSVLKKIGVENDNEENVHCKDYNEPPSQMTGGRLLARFLSRFSWYYSPKEGGPDLDRAWAHYEHMTLARVYTDEGPKKGFVRAPFGERTRPTRLYPLWSTPVKSMADFGVSVRMYFSTLLAMAGFFAFAGVLNLPLISYFWGDNYSDGTQDLSPAVRGSAVCVDTQQVKCFDCFGSMDADRLTNVIFAFKNACNFDDWLLPGVLSWGSSILLVVQFGVAFFWLQRKAEIVFDEDMQTASDYSIKVNNPPNDALDPDEWEQFFSKFGKVAYCTVAINNAMLLQKLASHKKIRKQLAQKLPADCDIWDSEHVEKILDALPPAWNLPLLPSAPGLWLKLQKLKTEIADLCGQQYMPSSIYVTFDTERAQRDALHTLSASKLSLWKNKIDTSRFDKKTNQMIVNEKVENARLPDQFWEALGDDEETRDMTITLQQLGTLEDTLCFRGTHVLNVKESCEPTDVRWMDLQVSYKIRMLQFMATTAAVICFMTWSFFFIARLNEDDSASSVIPIFIAVTNILVPKICEFINKYESHSTEGARQASLYVKVALFRWFNSAIALLLVMGFTNTISFSPSNGRDNLNQAIYNLIFAELFTIPIIKLTDIMGIVRKHILAPRAADQDEMNSYFVGGKFELQERYCDMTKVVFVSLFYSSILPSSLFLGALALMIHFAVAKFCLLRMWRPSPDVGASLSSLSRNYFFSSSLIIHFVMSAYWWSGYPFDNLCEGQNTYNFCNQDFLRSGIFPPIPSFQPEGLEWMTESQATITGLYAWTAVVMVGAGIFFAVKENMLPYLEGVFRSTYEPDGADQKIPFSSVKHLAEVMAYVPQLRLPGFSHPLLVCDISRIDPDVIGWKDEDRGFLQHSLFHEANQILGSTTEHVVFSQIRQYGTAPISSKESTS